MTSPRVTILTHTSDCLTLMPSYHRQRKQRVISWCIHLGTAVQFVPSGSVVENAIDCCYLNVTLTSAESKFARNVKAGWESGGNIWTLSKDILAESLITWNYLWHGNFKDFIRYELVCALTCLCLFVILVETVQWNF